MPKWQIHTYLSCELLSLPIKVNASLVWTRKDKNTGKTDFDKLQELSAQGWELVSVTPITFTGSTRELLYTFKRPIEETN